MTTKEKVILESIKRINKEIGKIDSVLESDPVGDIIALRRKAAVLAYSEAWKDKDTLAEIHKMAEEEKRLFALVKKRKRWTELTDRKIRLQFELVELNDELYFINLRKS